MRFLGGLGLVGAVLFSVLGEIRWGMVVQAEVVEEGAVRALVALYEKAGKELYNIGESITQSQHAEQAARLAQEAGFGDDVVFAALFHDVGHLLGMDAAHPLNSKFDVKLMPGGLGTENHENIGAEVLRYYGFPEKTAELVARHVEAKRYLCWKNESYHSALSPASKGTLVLQGGPMMEEEALKFEKDPLFREVLLMRNWDEEAKVENPTFEVPKIESYVPRMIQLLEKQRKVCSAGNECSSREFGFKLSPEQIKFWDDNGFIIFKDIFSPETKENIQKWSTELQFLPPTPGKWMHYYEGGSGENKKLSRTENFLPFHDELRALLTTGPIIDALEQILRETPVLFKEKVNYKLPGGGGFPAHQDAPAFTTFKQKNHLTVNVAIDKATVENGCLDVARGEHKKGLFPQNPAHGGLTDEAEQSLKWETVELDAGDVLVFSSWIPHRSGPNNTNQPRRALYVTYNGKSDGAFRDQYYEDKRERFPQECERDPTKDYSEGAKLYNLATPITG